MYNHEFNWNEEEGKESKIYASFKEDLDFIKEN